MLLLFISPSIIALLGISLAITQDVWVGGYKWPDTKIGARR